MGLVGLPSSTRAGWESLPASSCAGSENIFDRRNLTSLKAVWDDANGLAASERLAPWDKTSSIQLGSGGAYPTGRDTPAAQRQKQRSIPVIPLRK
jgi:hypothetical protein